MQEAIRRGDLKGVAALAGNVLESVTIPAYPIIGEIKQMLREMGALTSLMSGSGPTVFGLFDNYELVQRAKEQMNSWGKASLVYVTELFQVR